MPLPSIDEASVRAQLETLFGEDLHAKRVLSLAHATLGVVHAASLSIHAVGRALAEARGSSARHAVKQVDRLLSNEAISPWTLAETWVPFVLGERAEALISVDWTEFDADDQLTLMASLVTNHGRATPLLWKTVQKSGLKGHRAEYEDTLFERLREVVPAAVKVTLLCDRGFADSKLFAQLPEWGYDFVVRVKEKTQVRNSEGKAQRAGFWLPPNGRTLKLKSVTYTEDEVAVPAFVCTKKSGMKEPWFLATSLHTLSGPEVVKLYGRRFTIEEGFRDVKDNRFGMGLSATHVGDPERRDRLLFLSAIAITLLTLLGAAGEAVGIDRHFKTSIRKRRQYSLFRQGCMYYDALPNMRAEWMDPLMRRFGELVRAQPVFRDTLGFI